MTETNNDFFRGSSDLPSHGLQRFALLFFLIAAFTGLWLIGFLSPDTAQNSRRVNLEDVSLENQVLSRKGITIPLWQPDLGKKLIAAGVITPEKFEGLYDGKKRSEARRLLDEFGNGPFMITPENADIALNILWAFGLANKNRILEEGPIARYAGAASLSRAGLEAAIGNFASTAGWPLARGDAVSHYSEHTLVLLNAAQQERLETVAKSIYRPCCTNSTYFPDCNHGMAMLGLLEFLAAQNMGEKEMREVALQLNAYWFPEQYLAIASYLRGRGIPWDLVRPEEILGPDYSSALGYRQILENTAPVRYQSEDGCGV